MGFPYKPVDWEAGKDNIGGLSTTVWFCPQEAIETMPAYKDNEAVVREGEFKLTKGAGFVRIYATYKTANFKADVTGSEDGRVFKLSGDFFHPGNDEAMAQFARATMNTPGVLIFQDSEGQLVIMGDKVHPMYVSPSYSSGKKPDDARGWTCKFEGYATRAISYYKGTIPEAATTPTAPGT